MHENTQTSMVGKIHEKHRKIWIKNTQNLQKLCWLKKFTEKKPTVRKEIKFFTNLTARCEPRHSTLSSWDKNYLNLFSSVHN